jgi:PAS domain S-box-containing protein
MEPNTKLTELTFHMIVDSSPNAVVLMNEKGRIAYVNRQCESLFGYSAPEMIGRPVEDLIPPRFQKGHVALRDAFVQAPTVRRMGIGRDLHALRKDGVELPVEIGLNPLVLVDGTWVQATFVDISERKRAESRFRKVVDSAPNAMILVNRSGIITLVNQQAINMFGYPQHELIGQSVDMLLPDRIRAGHGAHRDSFFKNPQTRGMGIGRDLFARRRDGSEFPVEIGLNPIQMDEGVGTLASVIDITERRAQQDLRAKKEAAEAATKAKGELLAVASHDLKNPLVAIAGLAEILLEMKKADSNASPQDVELLQSIYDASHHMSEVIKGILENEGLEQQGLSLDKQDVDLSALCADLVHINEGAAARKNIALVADIEPAVMLHGDGTRLREAFDNYVSNAVKYSPAGKTVTVTLKTIDERSQIEFGVRDQGPGLTDEDKAKLFGKFKRLSARPTGGESSTGLGLSIVKTIIELHKGRVGCDSTPGEGAYFWARLPLKHEPAGAGKS